MFQEKLKDRHSMPAPIQIKRPNSLSKIAEDHIRESIVRGRFRMGESLLEVKLSDAMGISKTPIREALSALNLQGLVQIIPQRGAFVFSLSKQEIVELCQFRLLLETAALDQSFAKSPMALRTELENIVMKMATARDTGAFEHYLDLDSDFHDAFFNHCGNHYLCEGYNKVSDIVKTMRTYLSKTKDRITKSFEEHQAITGLLKDGKLKAAKTVLKTQITRGDRASADLLKGIKL
jgi:DNA-binding GntR family transcriptional regulator